MKLSIRFTTARLVTTVVAAAALLSALPGAANAAEPKFASLATAPLAKGAGYELPNGTQPVRHLQRQLRRLGQRPGPIDGLFGPLTEGAVRRFQRQAGVRVDGLVGPKTAARLARSMTMIRREAVKRERRHRRHQVHRSQLNDRSATVDSGRTAPRESVPAPAERVPVDRTGGTPRLIVELLVVLCVALALALLATLTTRSRASGARRHGSDLPEPGAPAPTPPIHNGDREIEVPAREDRTEISPEQFVTAAAYPPSTRRAEARAAAASATEARAQRTTAATESPPLGAGVPVIGYVSVSEEERLANGEDYAAQARAIETFCRRRGLRLVRIVRDVVGVDSRSAAAPGLQHACQTLAAGEARALVVQGLGRLTHSPARLGTLLSWLMETDRALISIGSRLDTSTAAGRRTAETLIEVGEWDRERAAQRRNRPSVRKGGAGRPSVRDLPELHARIEAMREQGLSLHAIADRLNAEGVPTLRGGARWRASSVQAAVGYRRPTARDATGLTLPMPTPMEEAE